MITLPKHVQDLADQGALFVVNHSGGKDSQAMMALVSRLVPQEQIVVIHAHLYDVEWAGTWEHVQETTKGFECRKVAAGKSLFDMAERRGMWPSPSNRQCTSDLKRDPIAKEVRHICKERGQSLVVHCIGLRAEESSNRAKKETWKFNKRESKAGREVYEWLPIHHLLEAQVFDTIAQAGQQPHWAYLKGMSRLSCCFCIMASQSDLTLAARLNPELYQRYVETEKRLDQTLLMPSKTHGRRFLEDVTRIPATIAQTA